MSYLLYMAIGITLLIIEVLTGTLFCLAFAISAFVAAAVAWFITPSLLWQLGIAAGSALLVCTLLGWSKSRTYKKIQNANPDIGRIVFIDEWHDRHASVRYRGAVWNAVLKEGCREHAGKFAITGFDSATLILEPATEEDKNAH